ncbi:MAG: hypothetical protein DSO00_05990, partial [Archaeoglobi archaeon]
MLVLVLLCLQTASAETPISSCTDINSPGYYNLTQNLTGLKSDAYAYYCIGIFASDVILDGNGYSLTGPGYGDGIYVSSVSSNVTIENLTVSQYGVGIYLESSSNNTITNVTAISNNEGIYLESASDNTITNVTAIGNDFGIYLESSNNNTIKDSVLQNNGLVVWESYNNVVENTTVNG